ncbi:MAG TPA: hypothetical protein VFC19_49420 [Candidatus Limnocylindrales bacterium]|nr:hypothetical protein [Candidatus Limnocylindrales bacterium]
MSAPYEVRDETGVPGAVIESVELTEGLIAERNGVGSIVAYVYPFGFEDEHADETPADRVERLAQELKEARKALKAGDRQ